MNHLALFNGIGGFQLAAHWAGWNNIAHVEIDDFCNKVVASHFPESKCHLDIKEFNGKKYAESIDIISGGFPCQPFSTAGYRKGTKDDRHLWPEMLRIISEVQPSWVVGENVHGIINWDKGLVFDTLQTDLETEGFDVWPYVLPACSVNAPHRRVRVWFVAYNSNAGIKGLQQERKNTVYESKITTNTNKLDGNISGFRASKMAQLKETKVRGNNANRNDWRKFPTQPPVCSRNDGISSGLDGISFSSWRNESVKAFGNAIVPQVAYQIFKTINEFNSI